jgi:N-methylhydantoinase B
VIRIQAPNGAGYGDPLERDPAEVVEDIVDGFTTAEIARSAYGVVLRDGTLELDLEATAAERRRRAAAVQASTTTRPSSTSTG